MAKYTLNINKKQQEVEVSSDTPLLWAIREDLGLTGTKFGCGVAACGACSVHIDGEVARSCAIAVADAAYEIIMFCQTQRPFHHFIKHARVESNPLSQAQLMIFYNIIRVHIGYHRSTTAPSL